MTKIVNVEAYDIEAELYVPCEAWVDMEAHGVNSWTLKSVDGNVAHHGHDWPAYGIDPITYDQVDAAARLQLLGEK
jgi:hypothetical protein